MTVGETGNQGQSRMALPPIIRGAVAGQGLRPGQLLPAGRQVRYAQAVNRLHGRSGHLWQNRFCSCSLDGDSFMSKMETLVGRRLCPLPVGRSRKKQTAASPGDAGKGQVKAEGKRRRKNWWVPAISPRDRPLFPRTWLFST